MKRTIWALRVLAVVWAVEWIIAVGVNIAFQVLLRASWEGEGDYDAIGATLEAIATFAEASHWVTLTLMAGAAIAVALSLRGTESARFGWLGVGLYGFIVVWVVLDRLVFGRPSPLPAPLRDGLWVFATMLEIAGPTFILLAGAGRVAAFELDARGTESSSARRLTAQLITVLFALAVASGVILILRLNADPLAEGFFWAHQGIGIAAAVIFVVVALSLTSEMVRLERGGDDAGPTAPGRSIRLLGWGLMIRVGVAVGASVAIVFAARSRSYGAAEQIMVVALIVGLAVTVLLLIALAGYHALPPGTRHGPALRWAAGTLLISVVVDVIVTLSAAELFGTLRQIEESTSFWSMPSLATLETHQGVMRWGGHVAGIIGLIGSLCIVYSLKTTAFWLQGESLMSQSRRAYTSLAVVGGLFIVLRFVAETGLPRQLAVPLLVVAIVLVISGIGVLIDWLSLTFRVARAVDERDEAIEAFR